MKEICMFTTEPKKFVVVCSVSNITFEAFDSFSDAQKKATWMSRYHSRSFEVAKVKPLTIQERA